MKRVVLAGAGHAHAQVLLAWARAPLPGVELVLVSPHARAPYSGMVPGWLAGFYRFEDIVIDFRHLCAAAGARWVQAEVDAVDADRQQLRLSTGETLGFDLLSLNIGSTLRPPTAAQTAESTASATVLALRPLADLHDAYEQLLARWSADASRQDLHVTAVGGGAAGIESLLAVLARLRALRPDRRVHGALVARSASLLPGLAPAAQRAAARALARGGVSVQLGASWDASWGAEQGAGAGLVLWATGAEAHGWQRDPARRGTLAVSPEGFVLINRQLQSSSHPAVFAVGDCAQWQPPLPKAGVYAVRMGPVLTHNLRAALGEGQALEFRPQIRFLALLATGDGRAIASRNGLGVEGRWVARWKDHIDRGFIARFIDHPVDSAGDRFMDR